MSFSRRAHKVAKEQKLPLVQFVMDLRYCDPPGEMADFNGPLPEDTESIIRTMFMNIMRLHKGVKVDEKGRE